MWIEKGRKQFVVSGGHQVAIMAPTEVLAMQHMKSLKDLLRVQEIKKLNITILTGSDNQSERKRKLLSISSGEAKIVIGTHALFQRNVHFHNLRLAVIDEQHKFGVMQRFRLEKKGNVNSIIMSATPIPRSLALTVFSDRDLTTIKEKPKNRLSIETLAISVKKIRKLLDKLAKQMSEGQQVYWVCPLIEENENNHLSNSNDRFLYLRNEFSQFKVGLIHGQMPSEDKESELKKFNERKIDILVSTTVIEVGIDNPNATAIVIENANRFGLSQLHQLRGRVGRGDKKSYCFLVYDGNLSDQAIQRLKIMRETQDGFDIAEKDMTLRGSTVGEILQWGENSLTNMLNEQIGGKTKKKGEDDEKIDFDDTAIVFPEPFGLSSDNLVPESDVIQDLNNDRSATVYYDQEVETRDSGFSKRKTDTQ